MIKERDRQNISRLQKKIAADETYLDRERRSQQTKNIYIAKEDHDRQNIYLDTDCDRRNMTGSRKNIAIDETYLERGKRLKSTKHIWIAINETCDIHLDRDIRNVSGNIARDAKGDQKYPNRQNI